MIPGQFNTGFNKASAAHGAACACCQNNRSSGVRFGAADGASSDDLTPAQKVANQLVVTDFALGAQPHFPHGDGSHKPDLGNFTALRQRLSGQLFAGLQKLVGVSDPDAIHRNFLAHRDAPTVVGQDEPLTENLGRYRLFQQA